MDDYDDGRPRVLVSHAEVRTARVVHRCESCPEGIKPGERYHRVSWLADEDQPRWQVVKYHLNCGGSGARKPLPPPVVTDDDIPF